MQNRIKVWDIAVRLFHWSLVALFVSAYLTGEEHDGGENLHAYIGYAIIALLAFRIVWGLIGTRHARFTDFVCSPVTVIRYVKSMLNCTPTHYVGHNPLGGWMVLALLVSVSLTCWSGLQLYAAEGKGPLAHTSFNLVSSAIADEHEREREHEEEEDEHRHSPFSASERDHEAEENKQGLFAASKHEHEAENEGDERESDGEEFWEEIHEFFTYLTILLIVLHVTGVVIASRLHKENLVKAMITGYKETNEASDYSNTTAQPSNT